MVTKRFPNGQHVRKVPVDECDACGERVYDPDAMAMMAPAFKANKAHHAKQRKSGNLARS